MRPAVRHDLAFARTHVVGGLHEAQRHEVHAKLEAKAQIVCVFRRDRRGRQLHTRGIDPFVFTEPATGDHGCGQLVADAAATRSSIFPSSSSSRSPGLAD